VKQSGSRIKKMLQVIDWAGLEFSAWWGLKLYRTVFVHVLEDKQIVLPASIYK